MTSSEQKQHESHSLRKDLKLFPKATRDRFDTSEKSQNNPVTPTPSKAKLEKVPIQSKCNPTKSEKELSTNSTTVSTKPVGGSLNPNWNIHNQHQYHQQQNQQQSHQNHHHPQHEQPQQNVRHTPGYSKKSSITPPGPFIPPYSAAMLSASSPPNSFAYPIVPMYSPAQMSVPISLPRYAYPQQMTSCSSKSDPNRTANISSKWHKGAQQQSPGSPSNNPHSQVNFNTTKDSRSLNPDFSARNEKIATNKVPYSSLITTTSSKRYLAPSVPTLKLKPLSQLQQPPPAKRSIKQRKIMPFIYKHKIIFASPHEDLDRTRLPQRLNLSPPTNILQIKGGGGNGEGSCGEFLSTQMLKQNPIRTRNIMEKHNKRPDEEKAVDNSDSS